MVVTPQNADVGRIKDVSKYKNTPTTAPINEKQVTIAAPFNKLNNNTERSFNCSRSINISILLSNEVTTLGFGGIYRR